jgi:dihydroxy-acid dehydratase
MIAVVNSHTEINSGHSHLRLLGEKVKEGIYAAGGIPFEFNVPAPCDGLTEGNEGMRFILPQRELIADMVETHVRSMLFDGMVMIASCDKIIPGMLMAAVRLDLATIFLTGGPGAWNIRWIPGRKESVDHKDYDNLFWKIHTGTLSTCGACELMGTANTFQCLAEALGMTIPGSANVPGFHAEKQRFARKAGKRIVQMVEEELTARKILNRKAIENAIVMDLALGGSTNATLHLPALAHELGFELPLSVFNDYTKKIPTLCGISPNGPHGIIDLFMAGGVPAAMKMMQADLHEDALTVMGQPWSAILPNVFVSDPKVIPPRDKPFRPEGGTAILYGNLAPGGAVVKQSAVAADMLQFTGRARVAETEQEAMGFLRDKKIQEGEVLVIRNEGPKGGPGMPEMLAVTMAMDLMGFKRVALITDGRFSGASAGPCVGHVTPEAYLGGPIAALRDGDEIEIDIPNRKIEVKLSDAELKKRLENFKPRENPVPQGYLRLYKKLVSSAAEGAIIKL